MKISLLISLLTLNILVYSQSETFIHYNQNDSLYEILNKSRLDSILAHSKARLNYLVIFSNNCLGTHFLLQDINKYGEKYGNNINVILTSCEPYKQLNELKKIIAKYKVSLPKVYVIDSERYKDKKTDSRVKGMRFRNDIASECKKDIIGVPYNMVFNSEKKLVFHGYRNQLNLDSLIDWYIQHE